MKQNRAVREPFPGRHAGNGSMRPGETDGRDFMKPPESLRQQEVLPRGNSRNISNDRKQRTFTSGRHSSCPQMPGNGRNKRAGRSCRPLRRFAARAGILAGLLAVCFASALVSGALNEDLTPDKDSASANEETEYVNCAQKLSVVDHDINYSQSRDWEKQGVYVLINVRNDNREPVSGMMFLIVLDNGIAANTDTGGDYFKASGYVPPYGEGYMCALVHMDETMGAVQGEITPVDGYTCAEAEEPLPFGRITDFDSASDSYDVEIVNRSGRDFAKGTARVVALEKKYSKLSGAWGAGELSEDVKDGDTVRLKGVIVNPGFRDTKTGNYQVFLVDI